MNPGDIRSYYDEDKSTAETLCFDYNRMYGTRIKVIRIFNTFGPKMNPEDGRVISNFVIQALRGEPLTVYGDGKQTRSFCYVGDLIEGIVRMMGSAPRLWDRSTWATRRSLPLRKWRSSSSSRSEVILS